MEKLSSYPKIFQFGHKLINEILSDLVIVEEKVDGSQLSFGKINGKLFVRSKNCSIDAGDIGNGLFGPALKTINELEPVLHDGWTYRGETLAKPKHNSLVYNRVPKNNIIIFDIMTEQSENYLNRHDKEKEAERIGLEIVPLIYQGRAQKQDLLGMLDRESILGGKIEGIVIKNYYKFGQDGKPQMAKIVNEDFKEIHIKDWKKRNPNQKDLVQEIADMYGTSQRFEKAFQHLRDSGNLNQEMSDIPALLTELKKDIREECQDEIKEILWNNYKDKILNTCTKGLPIWYKQKLFDN